MQSDWLVKKFWNNGDVRSIFHHQIEFINENSDLIVKRYPMKNGLQNIKEEDIDFNLKKEDKLIEGQQLVIEAYKFIIKKDNYKSLINLINNIRLSLTKDFGMDKYDDEGVRPD